MGYLSIESLPGEEWREYPVHRGYLFSSLGRVCGPRGLRKHSFTKEGYPVIVIMVKGTAKTVLIHKAICQLWHGPAPEDKPLALHDNHIRNDNRADNLHWGSHQDNMDEMVTAGRTNPVRGAASMQAKLTQEEVDAIRIAHAEGSKISPLAKQHGVTYKTVRDIVTYQTWK